MIRVAIADDHPLIRDGFRKLISMEKDITLAAEAKNAAEVHTVLEEEKIDVLILDIGLPDKNGLEVLKDIQALGIKVRTLVLSMHPERRYAKRALHTGAAGYLTKDAAPEKLIEAIRTIYREGHYITSHIADIISSDLSKDHVQAVHETLSDREYQLLLLIGAGKAVKEIAAEWGISINTVHTYRKRLLGKLGVHSNAEIAQYALRHNLIE